MADLILRPSKANPEKPWALQLRYHDLSGADYRTIAFVDTSTAREITSAGEAYFLFGKPGIEADTRLKRAETPADADA